MRYIIFLFVLFSLVPKICFAYFFGHPYGGIQLGETSNHYHLTMLGLSQGQIHYEGFSGRIYAGLQFNDCIGVETGWLRFNSARVNLINGTSQKGKIEDNSIDALMVGHLRLKDHYYLLGKFGVSYRQAKPSKSIRLVSTSDYSTKVVAHYRPMFSLGVGYAFARQITIEGSYTQIMKHRVLPKGTLLALGVNYYL